MRNPREYYCWNAFKIRFWMLPLKVTDSGNKGTSGELYANF